MTSRLANEVKSEEVSLVEVVLPALRDSLDELQLFVSKHKWVSYHKQCGYIQFSNSFSCYVRMYIRRNVLDFFCKGAKKM